jgi:hypothetical protein
MTTVWSMIVLPSFAVDTFALEAAPLAVAPAVFDCFLDLRAWMAIASRPSSGRAETRCRARVKNTSIDLVEGIVGTGPRVARIEEELKKISKGRPSRQKRKKKG